MRELLDKIHLLGLEPRIVTDYIFAVRREIAIDNILFEVKNNLVYLQFMLIGDTEKEIEEAKKRLSRIPKPDMLAVSTGLALPRELLDYEPSVEDLLCAITKNNYGESRGEAK